MSQTTIWHNPRCSKSRKALSILEENNCDTKVVKYLETNPTKEQINDILKMLGISARELMRTKEDIYKELNLKDVTDEGELVATMEANPKLIERPILIKNGNAIIGRPTEKIAEFINMD